MKKVVIPPVEKRPLGKNGLPEPNAEIVCSNKCPFRHSDDVCVRCTMEWAIDGSWRFYQHPGPNCPGPGEYVLEKVVRPSEDRQFLRLHNEGSVKQA